LPLRLGTRQGQQLLEVPEIGHEGILVALLLICLGANCATFANDIAASKGWQGFNETRLNYGDEGAWVQTPIIKLRFVYPFFIGSIALMVGWHGASAEARCWTARRQMMRRRRGPAIQIAAPHPIEPR